MMTLFKVLAISLLATIAFVIGSAVLPYSASFKEGSQQSNPSDVVFLLLVNIWFTLTVLYIGKRGHRSKGAIDKFIDLCLLYHILFMTQIETIFFGEAFEVLSKNDG